MQTARELAEQLLVWRRALQDPLLLLGAHQVLGSRLVLSRRVTSARTHFEQALALYDPQQHRSHAFLYGHDPGCIASRYAALDPVVS